VTATAYLDTLADRFRGGWARRGRLATGGSLPRLCRILLGRILLGRGKPLSRRTRRGTALSAAHVTHDVRKRLEVVSPLLCRVGRQPDHIPAARDH